MADKPTSFICGVCGKRVRARRGSSFSNRATIYPADHKDETGSPCVGWSAGLEWHLAQAIEARSDETGTGTGSVHESAIPQGCAPTTIGGSNE